MGNDSAQNTCSPHVTQHKIDPASIDQEDGCLALPECGTADVVGAVPASFSLPGERVVPNFPTLYSVVRQHR